jgi:hypothetical protein
MKEFVSKIPIVYLSTLIHLLQLFMPFPRVKQIIVARLSKKFAGIPVIFFRRNGPASPFLFLLEKTFNVF